MVILAFQLRELEAARDGLQEEVKDREKAAVEVISSIMQKLNINYAGGDFRCEFLSAHTSLTSFISELDFRHVRQQKDVVLDRLDHLLKGDDANADKRLHDQKTDIRTLLLFAGEKAAQLAAAQVSTLLASVPSIIILFKDMKRKHGAGVYKLEESLKKY